MKYEEIIVIAAIVGIFLVGIFVQKSYGIFSIYPLVGTIDDLKISYQNMTSGCVVRLEKLSGSTTWVGVYDVVTQGRKNVDTAKSIGWINDTNYQTMVNLLANNPPSSDCSIQTIPSCNPADTNCNGIVDRTELGVYINSWIAGSVTRDNLGLAIQAWMG